MIPLTGRDAQILKLLAQVAAIGRHRKTFGTSDVVRVAEAHLEHPHVLRREAAAQRRRADAADAEVARLRAVVREQAGRIEQLEHPGDPWQRPPSLSHRRVAELTRHQAEVFSEICKGRPQNEIADELGLSRTSVTNYVHRATQAIGADNPQHAVSLALRGVVEIRVRAKSTRSRAA